MSFFQNSKAFSLTELLTTLGIVGVLAVVGIKSYQKQTNQAKTAEAKKSLAYVYSAERSFYNNWGGYHENLAAVGAAPTGSYNYDVGFGKHTPLNGTYGSLVNYPTVTSKDVLNVRECTTFKQICDGDCLSTIAGSVGSGYEAYFNPGSGLANPYHAKADCEVTSAVLLKAYTGSLASSGAGENNFRALATGQLKSRDIWSIDEKSVVNHEEDGTQ